jgi:glycosyltransferase involved in cell wall biosynthesis
MFWQSGLSGTMHKKLLVISHTPHHFNPNGEILGWGPTVNELNYLSSFWEELVHIGCQQTYTNNPSFVSYQNKNIRIALIPSFGGVSFLSKLSVFYTAPLIIYQIFKNIKGASHVQIRVPMGIGIYLLPLFWFIPRKFILWVKYANNWGHISKSSGYRFQRWFLIQNYLQCKVTINGFWPTQPKHCISFENPCISDEQLKIGSLKKKNFGGKLNFVFAGRMDENKGVDLILRIIPNLPKDRMNQILFLGDGPLKNELEEITNQNSINSIFYGYVSQEKVHEVLMEAHVLLLPSKSEGFPKIVAEAWNYGVIPIVSPVGSVPHYLFHRKNGFLMKTVSVEGLDFTLSELFSCEENELLLISRNGNQAASRFTFENYFNQLRKEVFLDN